MKVKKIFLSCMFGLALIILTACQKQNYTVDFYIEDDFKSSVQVAKGEHVSIYDVPIHTPRQDHTFFWTYKDVETDVIDIAVVEDMDIIGKYTAISEVKHTIDFVLNYDASLPSIEEVKGTIITEPNAPVRPDFILEGWYYNIELTEAVAWPITLNDDYVLYAKWGIVPIEDIVVKFYGMGDTVIKQVTVSPGQRVNRPSELEEIQDYAFVNWYRDSSRNSVFDFDEELSDDCNIYGKWDFNSSSNHYPYNGTYYNGIDFSNFNTQERSELMSLLELQPPRGYSSGYWEPCEKSALDPSNSSKVILIYNSVSVSGPARYPTWNKEHVWPQSKLTGSIGGDQHNLFPCNPTINSTRGSLNFVSGSGSHGKASGGYYPGDEWRGEVARTVMYMSFRYGMSLSTIISPALALQWHEADPVSEWEMTRNDILYENEYQKNRNPFVDHPELANILFATSGNQRSYANQGFMEYAIYPEISILAINMRLQETARF